MAWPLAFIKSSTRMGPEVPCRPAPFPPGMKRAMLEVVAAGAVVEPQDVQRYIRCTLLAAMNSYEVRSALHVGRGASQFSSCMWARALVS